MVRACPRLRRSGSRAARPAAFSSVRGPGAARRARPPRSARLADGGRAASWPAIAAWPAGHVAGSEASRRPVARCAAQEAPPLLAAPSEGEDIVADYAAWASRSAAIRSRCCATRLARMSSPPRRSSPPCPTAGRAAAGIVTCRQRPGTASGVVFVTLEDETGYVNVVVWNRLWSRASGGAARRAPAGVEGVVEREGEVVHLVARRLVDQPPARQPAHGVPRLPLSRISMDSTE